MSRLYAWINSDTRKTERTTRGNDGIKLRIRYGNKKNSKPALGVIVAYMKDMETPKITVYVPKELLGNLELIPTPQEV